MSASFKILRRLIMTWVEPGSSAIATSSASGSATSITSSDFIMSPGDDRAGDGGWIYWTEGTLLAEQRPITATGIAPETGDVTLANPFSDITPSGAEFEYHGRYPVKRGPGMPWKSGYLEWINYALNFIWFEDWISVSGVSGQSRYLLDTVTNAWLADRPKSRVLAVYGPRDATSNVRRESGYFWHIDDDAEAPELVFDSGGYNTGDTFYLKVARPCNTRIKIGGVWTDVSAESLNDGQFGLAADADECHANPSHVLAYVVMEAMNAMGAAQPATSGPLWDAKCREWAAVVREIKRLRLPRKGNNVPSLQAVGLGGGMMGRTGYSKGWGGW